ncbi:MAG: KamA family radical SAM protein [Planctomycetia bacterium]|nr:KamA family radical SAM protein [Planctomycetia bacterium]
MTKNRSFPKCVQAEEMESLEHETQYPFLATEHFVQTAERSSSNALLRQILPSREELLSSPYFTTDPLQEQAPTPENFDCVRILRKYLGRALLMTTPFCFGNCRFCFRRYLRNAPPAGVLKHENYQSALFQVAKDVSIHEIILSGGDPMTLNDDLFFYLLEEFGKNKHIARIRVHTRSPIFCPQRISKNFIKKVENFFERVSKPLYFVVHINHPDEISPETEENFALLHRAGVVLLQQGVLLRGVNDDVDVLERLYEKLANKNVLPYYLHQLDRVQGAAHFEVPDEEGLKIVRALRGRLSGYAVPQFVREIPGEEGKRPISELS